MKHTFFSGLALFGAVVLFWGAPASAAEGCACPGQDAANCGCKNQPAQSCSCGHEKVSKELYRCPMHPEVTSDKPDQRCPKCEMRLEKVSEAKTEEKAPEDASKKDEHKGHHGE